MRNSTRNWVYRCIVVIIVGLTSHCSVTDGLPRFNFGNNDDGSSNYRSFVANLTRSEGESYGDTSYGDYESLHVAFPKSPSTCSDCVCGAGRKTRIVGGSSSKIADYPWMVGIMWNGQFHCGGSLITRNHVLTAAHCLEGYDRKYYELFLGSEAMTRRSPTVHRRRVKSAVVHENFSLYNLNNDIAVIELDRPVPLDGIVRTVCLPQDQAIDYTGSLATALGWGRTKEGAAVSKFLQNVRVPVLSDEECDDSGYPKTRRTPNMFCAGYLEGRLDACGGDSGGPLMVDGPRGHPEVIGITSFGRGCARPKFPGVYTKLTNYLGWLQDKLQGSCVCPPPHPL